MRDLDDRALEHLLRQTLLAEAAGVPVTLESEALATRWRDRVRRGRRRRLAVLGVAAALVIPTGAFVAGLVRLPPSATSPYEAIVVRSDWSAADQSEIQVVAVRSDGDERLIATVQPVIFPPGYRFSGAFPSDAGWLALSASDPAATTMTDVAWAFIDLRDPGRPVRLVWDTALPGDAPGSGEWSPDGRFATSQDAGGAIVVEPVSGDVKRIAGGIVGSYGVRWTADGSALLDIDTSAFPFPGALFDDAGAASPITWRVISGDIDPGRSVTLADDAGPSDRGLASNLSRLQVCGADAFGCPGLPAGAVAALDASGVVTTRYRGELDARLMSAEISADGEAAWLLLDTKRDGRSFELARTNARSGPAVTAAVRVKAEIHDAHFVNVAPDDSVAAIAFDDWVDDPWRVIIMPTDGSSRGTYHDGMLAGFVASASADSWPGAPFAPVPGATEPVVGQALGLPSADEMLLGDDPSDKIVIQGSREPATGTTGGRETYLVGSGAFAEGIGIVAACFGVGQMTVEADRVASNPSMVDGLVAHPLNVDCETGYKVDQSGPTDEIIGLVRVTVSVDAGTAWRVLITEPAASPIESPTP